MVMMTMKMTGNLQCEATHGPSGATIETDAPLDVGGNATRFSPTDLLGTALLTCIVTTMGVIANRIGGIDMTGTTGSVEKVMSEEKPRRISQINITIDIPLNPDAATREKIEHAAHHCPVHHSLHPDIVKNIAINWIG